MKKQGYLIRYRITRIIREGYYQRHQTFVESVLISGDELRNKIDSFLNNGLEIISITHV